MNPPPLPPTPPVRVLIVEDDEAHAELLVRGLEASGRFEPVVARTLAEARSAIAAAAPDLVLADWKLPDGHGTDLLPPDSAFPVVVLTSHGNEALAVETIRTGATDYVVKSDQLFEAPADLVDRSLRVWRHVVVWDVEGGKELAAVEAPVMYTWDPVQRLHSIGGVRSVAFSPDGKLLAVGGMGKVGNIDHLEGKARVEVFDWEAGKRAAEFPGEKFNGLVNALRFAPDGSWLLGAGGAGEGFFQFYDVAAKKVLRQEKLPMHVHDVALSESGDTIYSVGHNRIVVHRLG